MGGGLGVSQKILKPNVFFSRGLWPAAGRMPAEGWYAPQKKVPLVFKIFEEPQPPSPQFFGGYDDFVGGSPNPGCKKKKTKKSTFHLGGGMTDFAHLVEGLSHIVHKNIYISSIKFTVLFTLSPPPSFDELLALTSCGGYL